MNRPDARSYAALLAASSVVVSKQIPFRGAPFISERSGLPTLGHVPDLIDKTNDDLRHKLPRAQGAALVYSANKRTTSHARRFLGDNETDVLDDMHRRAEGKRADGKQWKDLERSCPHCRLLFGALYQPGSLPPIAIVRHSARVNTDFDPDTNVAAVSIDKFQVLLPKSIAKRLIECSHPLAWHEANSELFDRSDAAIFDGHRWTPKTVPREEWTDELKRKGEGYVYEAVSMPWNGNLETEMENVIRIGPRGGIDGKQRPIRVELPDTEGDDTAALEYGYSLETCLRSSVGSALEAAAPDIDGGAYCGEAKPVHAIDDDDVKGLTARDMLHLGLKNPGTNDDEAILDKLYQGSVGKDPTLEAAKRHLIDRAEELRRQWDTPFWLATVSASKRIRFKPPTNGSLDLWTAATWMSPAILFVFLNRAVCQAPHFLVREQKEFSKAFV